jgi:hypothetical protein
LQDGLMQVAALMGRDGVQDGLTGQFMTENQLIPLFTQNTKQQTFII